MEELCLRIYVSEVVFLRAILNEAQYISDEQELKKEIPVYYKLKIIINNRSGRFKRRSKSENRQSLSVDR